MNDKLLEWAIRIQSIAQAGLTYGHDVYDKERYEALRLIAAEMVSERTDVPATKIQDLFCNEEGYQTPNGTWSLPGGWCDVDQSVASNVIKEAKEETGFEVSAERLIAVQDWRRHNVCNYAYGVIKVFVLCRTVSGAFEENIETTEIRYFGREELPSQLAVEKTTREQIEMCFDAYHDENWQTQFD